MIDLSIPVYAGGYRMDADALQAQMIEMRDVILAAIFSYEERRTLQAALTERFLRVYDRYPSSAELTENQIARAQELLPARGSNRDIHGWTVQEAYDRFLQLRSTMEREYGLVG